MAAIFWSTEAPFYCDKNWQIESEKQDSVTFCTNLPKKVRGSIYRNVTWQNSKKEEICL